MKQMNKMFQLYKMRVGSEMNFKEVRIYRAEEFSLDLESIF